MNDTLITINGKQIGFALSCGCMNALACLMIMVVIGGLFRVRATDGQNAAIIPAVALGGMVVGFFYPLLQQVWWAN